MSNIVGLDLNIDNDYLEEAVKQTVIMGISESLNGKNEIVSQIVNSVLSTKVDKTGKISSYKYDNKYTLLEYYVQKMITKVAEEELETIVNERREEIASMIRAELKNKVNTKKFVNAFFDNISTAIKSSWVPRIEVAFDQHKD